MSSPIFTMRSEPQQEQAVGASITTRSRGRCSGNGLRTGRRRSNPATVVVFANFPAAISSSVAAASSSSSCNSIWSISRARRSELWPYCSRRSLAISSRRCLIIASEVETTARACASSLSAASARASEAASAARNLAISEAASDMAEAYHAGPRKPIKIGLVQADLSRLCRALRPARIAPVDPLQKIPELGRGDLHRLAASAGRPDELSRLQALRVERHADPIVPEQLDQVALAPAKAEDLAGMRIAPKPCWTVSASVFMPRRMSVTPPAIQTRTPAGKAIIGPPAPGAAAPCIFGSTDDGTSKPPSVPQHDLELDIGLVRPWPAPSRALPRAPPRDRQRHECRRRLATKLTARDTAAAISSAASATHHAAAPSTRPAGAPESSPPPSGSCLHRSSADDAAHPRQRGLRSRV